MADKVVLSVGTRKGLFLLESNTRRQKWDVKGPFLKGWPIYHAVIDTRSKAPRLHVAASGGTFESSVFSGPISGKRLKAAEKPPIPPKLPRKMADQAKKWGIDTDPRPWHIEPGHASQKKVLYCGTAPAGLFRSEDSGKTWEPVDGINKHKSRKDWFSGYGGQCMHSIQIDAHDPNRIMVGISAAGVFRSDDGGKTFHSKNSAVAKYIGAPEGGQVFT